MRSKNRHLFNRNKGVGELRRLSEEELEERNYAVALQMEGLALSLNYATPAAPPVSFRKLRLLIILPPLSLLPSRPRWCVPK